MLRGVVNNVRTLEIYYVNDIERDVEHADCGGEERGGELGRKERGT